MINNYDPPLTDDYIYNLDRYLICDDDDSLCQFGQESSCNAVLELCWGNYPEKDCNTLSETCKKIFIKNKKPKLYQKFVLSLKRIEKFTLLKRIQVKI
ncbi:hypothetical protein PIROE2DRAFT_67436, partial [Piromyces sp. E2]